MDAVTAEKETAVRRYRRLRRIGLALRCLEACAAVAALYWSSARLPGAARASGDLLVAVAAFLLSPFFVFLLGNAIILVLFVKYRHHAAASSGGDLYAEFLDGEGRDRDSYTLSPPQEAAKGDEVYEDKEVCVESHALRRTRSARAGAGAGRSQRAMPEHRRAESVALVRRKGEEMWDLDPEPEGWEGEEGEMRVEDAEEFRQSIEAFIAKQLRFHREEEIIAVMPSASGQGKPKLEEIL